jgi:CHAT domain-containing protein
VDGYIDLVKGVHDAALTAIAGDPSDALALVATAIDRLPALQAAGELDPAAVGQFTALLTASGTAPVEVRYLVSEVNVAAARLLGDAELLGDAAHARARVCADYAAGLDAKADPTSVRTLAAEGLELAAELDLESVDPRLVADLHLQAGNPDMHAPAPTDIPLPRGLAHFLVALRIKRGLGDEDVPQLERVMTEAAHFLMASVDMPGVGRSDVFERVERATEVLAAVGALADLRAARLVLLRVALEAHALEVAEQAAGALAADASLDPVQHRELALSLADLRSQQHRPEDALAELDRAAVQDDDPRWRYAATIRGNALRIAGDLPAAEAQFALIADRVAAELAAAPRSLELQRALGHARTHLGMLAVEQGRVAEGEARFAEVDRIFSADALADVQRLEFLSLAATSLTRAAAWDAARARLTEALALRGRLAEAIDDAADLERFLLTWTALDERQVAVLLRAGDAAAALAVMEDAKSRVLRRMARIRPAAGAVSRDGSAHLRAAWARADAHVGAGSARLDEMAIGDPARPALAEEVRRRRRQADSLRTLLERKAVAALDVVAPHEATTSVLDDVAALAGDDWSVVSYFGTSDGIGVCVRAGASVDGAWLSDPSYDRLRDRVLEPLGRHRAALAAGRASVSAWQEALTSALAALHAALIAPVEETLRRHGARRLLIVPHRALHGVPFGALTDDRGAAVIDRYEAVAVVPAARLAADVMRRLNETPGPTGTARGGIVALAAPDVAAPLTAVEATAAAALWRDAGATLIVGKDADPAALFAAAPGARIVHLACHGTWDPGEPARSGLRLAPEPPGAPPLFGSANGLVNVAALLTQLNLATCRTAVLSACDTGLARVSVSDEPIGLPVMLMLAGSRATVASLWPVRDDSTLLLMAALHVALRAGATPAHALAAAQRELRSLSVDAAVARLEDARTELDGADLDRAIQERATRILDAAIASAAAAGSPPYAHPDHWAAFACTGAPAAFTQQEVPTA